MSPSMLDLYPSAVMDEANRSRIILPEPEKEQAKLTVDLSGFFEQERRKEQTLVVNLFGGPGTGKSTTAAGVFAALKGKGIRAELVHEFAKDLTWEKRDVALGWQPYIFGKQSYHIHRLLGQTDVVITDSPILLSSHIYSRDGAGYDRQDLEYLSESIYNKWNTLSVFLRRNLDLHPFVQAGRNQDEAESIEIDDNIRSMLADTGISNRGSYKEVRVGELTVHNILIWIEEALQ